MVEVTVRVDTHSVAAGPAVGTLGHVVQVVVEVVGEGEAMARGGRDDVDASGGVVAGDGDAVLGALGDDELGDSGGDGHGGLLGWVGSSSLA